MLDFKRWDEGGGNDHIPGNNSEVVALLKASHVFSFQSNQRVDLYKWKDGNGEVGTSLQGHTRVIRYSTGEPQCSFSAASGQKEAFMLLGNDENWVSCVSSAFRRLFPTTLLGAYCSATATVVITGGGAVSLIKHYRIVVPTPQLTPHILECELDNESWYNVVVKNRKSGLPFLDIPSVGGYRQTYLGTWSPTCSMEKTASYSTGIWSVLGVDPFFTQD